MAEDFKVGDVVQLNSGGPKMTVESIDTYKGEKRVHCVWFVADKKEQASFSVAALKRL